MNEKALHEMLLLEEVTSDEELGVLLRVWPCEHTWYGVPLMGPGEMNWTCIVVWCCWVASLHSQRTRAGEPPVKWQCVQ